MRVRAIYRREPRHGLFGVLLDVSIAAQRPGVHDQPTQSKHENSLDWNELNDVHVEPPAEGVRDPLEVLRIARQHEIASLQRPDHDRRINDIRDARPSARDTGRARLSLVEMLDSAPLQKGATAALEDRPSMPVPMRRQERPVVDLGQAREHGLPRRHVRSLPLPAALRRRTSTRSRRASIDSTFTHPIQNAIRRVQLAFGQPPVLRLPRSDSCAAGFDRERVVRRFVEPRGQADPALAALLAAAFAVFDEQARAWRVSVP